jgi:hypothetical protein
MVVKLRFFIRFIMIKRIFLSQDTDQVKIGSPFHLSQQDSFDPDRRCLLIRCNALSNLGFNIICFPSLGIGLSSSAMHQLRWKLLMGNKSFKRTLDVRLLTSHLRLSPFAFRLSAIIYPYGAYTTRYTRPPASSEMNISPFKPKMTSAGRP